jgi:hypothetical protein
MLIKAFIDTALNNGELSLLPLIYPSPNSPRHIYLTKPVKAALDGPWADEKTETRMAQAQALLEAFSAGNIITIRLPPSKKVNAMLALLEDANEQVWEFRSRLPRPGIRIFGRFAERDTFVATNYALKENSTTDDEYKHHKEICKHEWNRLFINIPPLVGKEANEYISNYEDVK